MKSTEALALIRLYGFQGRIRIDPTHAKPRMQQRGVSFRDVRHALATAPSCEPTDKGRWRVDGRDETDDALTVVVLIESDLLVITVF